MYAGVYHGTLAYARIHMGLFVTNNSWEEGRVLLATCIGRFMKKNAYLLTLLMILVPLSGCAGENDVQGDESQTGPEDTFVNLAHIQEIASLEEEISSLNNNISQQEAQISSYVEEIGVLNSEISALESEIASLQNNPDSSEEQKNAKIVELETAMASLNSTIIELDSQIVQFQQTLSQRDQTIVEYVELVGDIQSENTNLSAQITALNLIIEDLQSTIDELQSALYPYSCPSGSSISSTFTGPIYANPGVVFSDDSNLPDDHSPQAIDFQVSLDGSLLEGCEIRFEIEDGNGWFFPAYRQTNNDGGLYGYWTAGSMIGDQTMSAYITWPSGEREYLNVSGEVTDTSTRTNSIHLNYEPSGEYEEFSIQATPGTGPLATYYSTINWAGSYGGIQFDGGTTKVIFSTWDTNGMDAEVIDSGSCNEVQGFDGEGTGVSCRLILPPSVNGPIPGLPDDYMLVPGHTYETSIEISDCGTNCQDYSFFFTDITRDLGPISLGTQRYKSDSINNWASSFVEEWWPHGNCLSAERSVLFHDVKAKVNGEWEYFDRARFTPGYLPWNNEICANYYAEGTEDGFQLSSGGDRLVGQPRISGDSYFPYTRYIDIIVG